MTMLYARNPKGGYTLIELMVSVGIFAMIMVLAAGSYLIMIGINRHLQGVSTGIDNLAFALETMTRSIRTGSDYDCAGIGDCATGASSFSFVDSSGQSVRYSLADGRIYRTLDGASSPLTESSVNVTSLTFYARGTGGPPDYVQPYVTMVITGTTPAGKDKPDEPFAVQTSASMRGTDL